MKRALLILSILLLTSAAAMAEDDTSSGPTHAVSVNLFGVLVNYYGAGYEAALGKNFSLRAEAGVSPNLIWATGFGLFTSKIEARYYFGHAVSGFYLGAAGIYNAAWGSITSSGITDTFSASLPGLGAYFGGKWVLGKNGGFFLEPYVGYEAYFSSISVTAKDSFGNSASTNVTPPTIGGFVYGLGMGWAF